MCRKKIRNACSGTIVKRSNAENIDRSFIDLAFHVQIYSTEERGYFLSKILFNLCHLAMNVDKICSRVRRNGSFCFVRSSSFSLRRCSALDRTVRSLCPNSRRRRSWRAPFSVCFLDASIRRSAANTKIFPIRISTRQFVALRSANRRVLQAFPRRSSRRIGVEIRKVTLHFPLLSTNYREE